MHDFECRNCGNFTADIDKADSTGFQYDCQNCNYKWFVPYSASKLKRILAVLSFGLIGC